MEAILSNLVNLAQWGAVGVLAYGFILTLRADVLFGNAFHAAQGEGVAPSHPANLSVRAQ